MKRPKNNERRIIGRYGPVAITAGKHRGTEGLYDDDEGSKAVVISGGSFFTGLEKAKILHVPYSSLKLIEAYEGCARGEGDWPCFEAMTEEEYEAMTGEQRILHRSIVEVAEALESRDSSTIFESLSTALYFLVEKQVQMGSPTRSFFEKFCAKLPDILVAIKPYLRPALVGPESRDLKPAHLRLVNKKK